MAKAAFNETNILFTSKLDVSLRQKLIECCLSSIALCVALKLGHCGK
jgi:hypothetical protein